MESQANKQIPTYKNEVDQQKNGAFMSISCVDPFAKREQFAVSLRKKKKAEKLQEKRSKIMKPAQDQLEKEAQSQQQKYYSCPLLDKQRVEQIINQYCPDFRTEENLPEASDQQESTNLTQQQITRQVQILISIFISSDGPSLTAMETLAFLIQLRTILAMSEDVRVFALLHQETELIQFARHLAGILIEPQGGEKALYYMRLELMWILTNIVCGPKEITEGLFWCQINAQDQQIEQSTVVTLCQSMLQSNTVAEQDAVMDFLLNALFCRRDD